MRILSVLVLLALGVLVAPAPAATAQTAPDYERGVHALTNAIRGDHDVAKLRKKACVQKYADRQAAKMAKAKKMYHQDLGPILKDCDLSLVGENVAYGFTKVGALMRAWMDSPGHAANITESRYRQLGVGAKKSKDGVWYVAQVFGTT